MFLGIVSFLQGLPPIVVSIVFLIFSFFLVIIMGMLFNESGIYLYIILAVTVANIQVLKLVQFPFFPSPIALGTELFASTYFAVDVLIECYGRRKASKGVFLGFIGMFLWVIFMMFTLGFAPAEQSTSIQISLESLFSPVSTIFIASVIAYFISHHLDVYVFQLLKDRTDEKFLWLRNNISTILSTIIDNVIFSILAWYLLARFPLPFSVIIHSYIIGSSVYRILIAIIDTPFLYIARSMLHRNNKYNVLS